MDTGIGIHIDYKIINRSLLAEKPLCFTYIDTTNIGQKLS